MTATFLAIFILLVFWGQLQTYGFAGIRHRRWGGIGVHLSHSSWRYELFFAWGLRKDCPPFEIRWRIWRTFPLVSPIAIRFIWQSYAYRVIRGELQPRCRPVGIMLRTGWGHKARWRQIPEFITTELGR